MNRRLDITSPSGDNDCSARLCPPGGDRPVPVVVMAHGTRSRPELDPDRLVILGSPVGGGHVLPLHVTVCEADSVAPARARNRLVKRVPRAEVVRRPVGDFGIYPGAELESVADRLSFLHRHVPVAHDLTAQTA